MKLIIITILCLISMPAVAEMKCERRANFDLCQDDKQICFVYPSAKKQADCVDK